MAYLAFIGEISLFKHPRLVEMPQTSVSLVRGPAVGRRIAWIISYTGVSNEPRVIRQSQALLADGWRLVVCGYDGHSPRPAEWTYLRLPAEDPYRWKFRVALHATARIGALIAALAPAPLSRLGAMLHHFCTPNWMHTRHSVAAVAAANPDLKPDLVLCNDYFTCSTGYPLARRYGARFAVDCHEYAAEQNAHDVTWTRWTKPCVVGVQDHYLRRADVVSTVCQGIAELLDRDHELKRPALVVRSVPMKQTQPFRPAGERIKVLYHGGLWPVRQLHVAIESMPLWRQEFDLVLRGEGDAPYIAELKSLAERHGVEKRVFIEPAVPFADIVPAANRADIGYFSYANFSRQSQFVLPNKFFEYVMAGLALCVIDLSEMGKLVRRHDLGKCIPSHDPQSIAATINSFTRADIDRLKRNALSAAEELNWECEKGVMMAAYDQLFVETDRAAVRRSI